MKNTKKQLVVKANQLIEAPQNLTLQEQRIILFLISKIKKEDKEFHSYSLSIKDFQEIIGIRDEGAYTKLRKITLDLRNKGFEMPKPDGDVLQIGWLSSCLYRKKKGIIELEISPKLKPYLLQLQKEWTPLELMTLLNLRNPFGIRIYELLRQYKIIKERFFELDDLKKKLGLLGKYDKYANFKSRVLIPAKKLISERTDIEIDFKEKKSGRKVIGIHFFMLSKDYVDLLVDEDTNETYNLIDLIKSIDDKQINTYLTLTETYKLDKNKAKILIKKYGFDNIRDSIAYAKRIKKQEWQKQFNDFEKFIAHCIKEGLGQQLSLDDLISGKKESLSPSEIKKIEKKAKAIAIKELEKAGFEPNFNNQGHKQVYENIKKKLMKGPEKAKLSPDAK